MSTSDKSDKSDKSEHSWVTEDMFNEKLDEIVEESGWDVPGVHEILSEYYNNDVLKALEDEREDEDED
jgi:hypothetical protein|tara:strand:+ start:1079 stop:1282 length:204 start_codon:yes stop_codon:yes gene_type:complete